MSIQYVIKFQVSYSTKLFFPSSDDVTGIIWSNYKIRQDNAELHCTHLATRGACGKTVLNKATW